MAYKYFATLVLCLSALTLTAQTPEVDHPFQMLAQYDSLEVYLEADFKKLPKDKTKNSWLPAVFQVRKGETILRTFEVSIQARGNNRREVCDMPPLKIRFAGAGKLPDSVAELRTLKMVAPCKGSSNYETLILKEALTYSLYEHMTPESFRTKLVRITLKDRSRKNAYDPVHAFFIEPEAELADRLNCYAIKPTVMSPRGLEESTFNRVCVFQYMVGNTDWTPYNRHNIRILIHRATKAVIAVPYDFDYCGAVDAPYAVPQTGAPIQHVRQRYFFGLCRPKEDYQRVFDAFLAQKDPLLKRCDTFPYLSKSAKEDVKSYIESFFPILENPKAVRKEILEHCDNFKKG